MKAYDVVGYTFDGAIYCPQHVPQARDTDCECGKVDECGACESNCHGYGPNPVFATDVETGDACDVEGCGYLEGAEPEERLERLREEV